MLNFLDYFIKRFKEKEKYKAERSRIIKLAIQAQKDVLLMDTHHTSEYEVLNHNGKSRESFENILDAEDASNRDPNTAKCFDLTHAIQGSKLYYSTTEFLHNLDSYSRKIFP